MTAKASRHHLFLSIKVRASTPTQSEEENTYCLGILIQLNN